MARPNVTNSSADPLANVFKFGPKRCRVRACIYVYSKCSCQRSLLRARVCSQRFALRTTRIVGFQRLRLNTHHCVVTYAPSHFENILVLLPNCGCGSTIWASEIKRATNSAICVASCTCVRVRMHTCNHHTCIHIYICTSDTAAPTNKICCRASSAHERDFDTNESVLFRPF